jgi:hypothetical protein
LSAFWLVVFWGAASPVLFREQLSIRRTSGN